MGVMCPMKIKCFSEICTLRKNIHVIHHKKKNLCFSHIAMNCFCVCATHRIEQFFEDVIR
jgi:hypothetical protein